MIYIILKILQVIITFPFVVIGFLIWGISYKISGAADGTKLMKLAELLLSVYLNSDNFLYHYKPAAWTFKKSVIVYRKTIRVWEYRASAQDSWHSYAIKALKNAYTKREERLWSSILKRANARIANKIDKSL